MKRFTFLSMMVLIIGILNAQEIHRFRASHPQGLNVESSTSSSLSLHYSIQELGIANIDNGETKGQEIILKGQFIPNAEGCPNLPVVNRYIAVPQGASVNLQIKENASTVLQGIDLLPAAPAQTDNADRLPQLQRNSLIYGNDSNFPAENIVLSTPTKIRNLDVVLLSITPFRYNPIRQTLEVIYDIDIDIRFEGGNGQFGESRYLNPDWEHILRDLVINGEMIPTTDYYRYVKSVRDKDEEGCEYLIIAPDNEDILAWADTLKNFRTKQGVLTKVVSLTECGGNNTNSIRNYILNAYNTWAIPPAAVLLFGGYHSGAGIVPWYHYTVQDEYTPRRYPTDYPYCDMNGDSLADVAISRITARNIQEYQTFVEKTIQYESNPPTDADYYDHPIITAGHQDNKWFMLSSQSINGFYRNNLGKHPTDQYMLHSTSVSPPDSVWSTGYNASTVFDYFGPNGQSYIPELIGDLNEWITKSDTVPLHTALKEGAFLTMYRGHSNYNAWWFPAFAASSLNYIVNEPLTFVLSISCSTALFTESGRGLIDAFCIKQHGGAVGGIGATSLTHSYYNDVLAWGIIDCIWPDFLPDLGGDTPPDFVRPSYVLAAAKHYFAYHVFLPGWWPEREHSTMHLFCFTGDTYLNLYTEVPQPLQITHGIYHPAGTSEFIVTAEEGSVVCLSKDDDIIDVFISDGQPYTFTPQNMIVGEHLTLTATKQNHLRYEYEIPIISNNGPYVVVEKDGLSVENEFNVLHSGENAHIGIELHNYGNNVAGNATMTLSCESPFVEITQGTCHYQNLAPHQTATLQNAFHFNIADNIPDMTEVVFNILVDDGNGVKECSFIQQIAAPSLVVKHELFFENSVHQNILQLDKEDITDIHVQIANEGHFDSNPVNMQFEILAPFITIESPSRMFNSIERGGTRNAVFRVHTYDDAIDNGLLMTKITINDGIYQTTLDTMLPFGGFNESFDTGYFNTHGWLTMGNAPWVLTDEEAHTGEYSSQSGVINHSQSSSMTITQTTPSTEISFFKKVFSEFNYDKLHFYIDDVEMGVWSGSRPWSEERFTVAHGTHTFKWSYTKDGSVSLGHDCAWIDDFNIDPTPTTIAYSGGVMKACKDGEVNIDCAYAYYFQDLMWTTMGDGHFIDNHALHPVYIPGPQDIANGGTRLKLNVDGNNNTLQLLLTDEINMGDIIIGDDYINPEEIVFSHYSVEYQEGVDYIWSLEPQEAGYVFAHGNNADIVWDFNHGITEAALTVSANASCSQSLTKTIHIDVLSVEEQPASSFTLFPNPTDGKVNLLVGKDLQGKSVIEVYTVLGTRMTHKVYQNLTHGQIAEIDLQHYTPGIYIIKLHNDADCWSKKISVK